MVNKKRLIDANELKAKAFPSDTLEEDLVVFASDIDDAPTINAAELPCKMGDTVWGIKKYYHRQEVKQGTVHQMFFGDDMRLCICVKTVCRGEWGKNVFATKEEAEAALAKGEVK